MRLISGNTGNLYAGYFTYYFKLLKEVSKRSKALNKGKKEKENAQGLRS